MCFSGARGPDQNGALMLFDKLTIKQSYNLLRPNGPAVQIAWPIGPGHGPHTRPIGPTGQPFDPVPYDAERPAR